jgi:hypothetical protein
MEATRTWTLKDWLQAGANLVIIVGGITGGAWFVNNARTETIAANRQAIVRAWTNEGDILSTETRFVALNLQDYDGDIIGSLSGPGFDDTLDVQADIGWFSSTLTLTQLRGRSVVPVASVRVKLTGNDNRLSWQVMGGQAPAYLPSATTLWPNPAAPR